MHPSREEFNELVFYIAGLKSQFTSKIDEQTIKINDHSEIVEELLWQIRELSDKIRQMNQKVEKLEKKLQDVEKKSSENNCICHYQNHLIPARIRPSRSIFSRQTSMLSRKSNSIRSVIAKRDNKTTKSIDTFDDEDNDAYETIEFTDSSSSNFYTEPIDKTYGTLRRSAYVVKTKQTTEPKVARKSIKVKALKKSHAMTNLQLLSQSEDEECLIQEKEKIDIRRNKSSKNNNLLPNSTRETNRRDTFTRQRDASGIFVNLECSKSNHTKQELERTSV